MRDVELPFEVDLEDQLITIAEHEIGSKRVFHVDFKGWRKPLVISIGIGADGRKFWTSIPQGRQG